jgi:hypothetical protein
MANRSPRWKWLLLSLLFIAGGIGGYLAWRQWGGGQLPDDTLDVAELIALKDRALGLAENAEYAEADKLLVQLARHLPDEPMIRRNLAIVRIGPLENMKPEDLKNPEKMARLPPNSVVTAVLDLLKAEPKDAASHIMASRAARRLQPIDREAALKLPDPLASLQVANKLDPNDAAARFELYNLVGGADYLKDEVAQLAGRQAIAEAYKLQPRNVTLFIELVKAQIKAKDPALKETLSGASELLSPLRPLVQREHPTVDIEQNRVEAVEALNAGDWKPITRKVSLEIVNLLNVKMVQKTDRLRVEVGALEYLRHDFSDAFYEKHGHPPPSKFSDTTVRFAATDAAFPSFTDVRDLRLVDADLDGRLDMAVLHGTTLSVLARPRGKQNWEPLLACHVPDGMQRLVVADLDRDVAKLDVTNLIERDAKDADAAQKPDDPSASEEFQMLQVCHQAFPDFLLYGPGGIAIVRSQNASATEKVAPSGGLLRKLTLVETKELQDIGNVRAAAAIDFDHDQDLDLVLGVEGKGIRLWRMLGNGTFRFEDYTNWSAIPARHDGRIADLAIVDWNRDLYTDILVCFKSLDEKGDERLAPLLLVNQRHGQFYGEQLTDAYKSLADATALAPIELDGNVSWDLVALGEEGVQAVLTTTPAPGKVDFLKSLSAAKASGRRLLTWDYDNDTYTDLLAWGEAGATVLRGTPDGFQPLDARLLSGLPGGLVAIDYGDLDGDHDLDFVAASADKLVQIDNDGGDANPSLIYYVTGAWNGQNIGTNNSAIGTTVEARTSGRYQAQVITRQPVHIGLASAKKADLVRLIFTNGIPRSAPGDHVSGIFCEEQRIVGSCPFVYCWDGKRFSFFTDCLWAAPIGLQVAEGKMAPSRAWEYLLLPGERLKQRDGTYDLQLTEELWEAAYFDEVKLIAVDHPADTDLYTNEKVGGPNLAAPKLHLVRQPRRPVAARDKHGRDVLSIVSQRDNDYFRGFDRHIMQGLVDEHFLELDLGQLEPAPRRVTLFLTGWIYPTNTSINVNLSQHPDLQYPRHPYVQVADGQGGWKEVQAFMGFPGGKTKVIAVELAGDVFTAGDYRLRIGTSAEIYWDDVFFTVDEEPIVGKSPLVNEHQLPLVSADLHFRGFSRDLPRHPNAPLRFDYSVVSPEPKWPPMGGFFTRYGDVAPLLAAADDRMVVIGSGDEMTVRFRAPAEEPPPGWKRDFILYSVGWDKDADLNTVYGQTAEPLPYNAMPSYPYPPDQWYPDTAENRHYLETYQTRQQPHRRFWRQLAP